MTISTMYAPQKDSPSTVLQGDILSGDTTFLVLNASILPQIVPFPLTIGFDTTSTEVVMVTNINTSTNQLTVAARSGGRPWSAGTKVARVFNADDLETVQNNVLDLQSQINDNKNFAINVTRTVGPGKDHTTIQSAIDWFLAKTCLRCSINVDPGTYAESLKISEITTLQTNGLSIIGDQRSLVGTSYVHGIIGNPVAINNGGSGNVTLSNSGNNITVSLSTTNPNFVNAEIVSGDKVIIRSNTGTIHTMTINSVSSNVLTLSTTAPAVGGNGSTITFLPNRNITPSQGGGTIFIESMVTIKGFTINPFNASSDGIDCVKNASLTNIVIVGGSIGLYIVGPVIVRISNQLFTVLGASNGCNVQYGGNLFANNCYMIHTTYGLLAQYFSLGSFLNSVCVGANYGFFVQNATIQMNNGIAINCNYGVYADSFAFAQAISSILRGCSIGLYAFAKSLIVANGTNANNTSTTQASPATSGVDGNYGSMVLRD